MTSAFPFGELSDAAELGAVDEHSVRVWVRGPGMPEVGARLEVEGHPPVTASVSLSHDTDWTGAIVLSLPEPAPGQPFTCTVAGRRLTGRLAPSPETHAGLTFGFGSCHQPFVTGKDGSISPNPAAEIYPAMDKDLREQEASFLLLIGDQVYSDTFHGIHVSAKAAERQRAPSPAEALDVYREIYRRSFQEPGLRVLRESFPTYCTWDDHDIIDNWGSNVRKSTTGKRLFNAACRAYCEYQNLRNPGGGIREPPYHYNFRYGDMGFMVLDVRGARDYGRRRLLGEEQWSDVKAYLHGEASQTVQTLFVVSSVPVAHASRWFVSLLERVPVKSAGSVRDRWCSSAFISDRDALLGELFAWQTAVPRRQVVLLSGDIHAAGAFTIRERNGRGLIRQCISSPLTTPTSRLPGLLTNLAAFFPNVLEPKFRFQRHFLTFHHNMGLVRVEPLEEGGHSVDFTVRSWQLRTSSLRTAHRLMFRPR